MIHLAIAHPDNKHPRTPSPQGSNAPSVLAHVSCEPCVSDKPDMALDCIKREYRPYGVTRIDRAVSGFRSARHPKDPVASLSVSLQ